MALASRSRACLGGLCAPPLHALAVELAGVAPHGDGVGPSRALAAQAGGARPPPCASSSAASEPAWAPGPRDETLAGRARALAALARLDKPTGTWLLAWPSLWSIALAAPAGSLPDPQLCALFGAGAVLLRGAGCTVNDLWDRELDSRVERTRNRPIASGAVSVPEGVAFLGAQLLAGLGILVQLNPFSVGLGASSLLLVGTYPLMKRVTNWPQAYLGLTINWGALLGWAAVHGAVDPAAVLPLYGSGALWTLHYDTVYAHQDKRDDVAAGVKSSALALGDRTRPALYGFTAASAAALCAAGAATGAGAPHYLGAAAYAAHLGWQARSVDLDSPADCGAKFASNQLAGGLAFAGIVGGRLLA